MNPQNPALYPPQQGYAYGPGMAQSQSQAYPNDATQHQFQQAGQFPGVPQGSGPFQPGQLPPHILQQLHQQNSIQQQSFNRGPHQMNAFLKGQRQPSGNIQVQSANSRPNVPQANNLQAMVAQAQRAGMNQPNPQIPPQTPTQTTNTSSKPKTQTPPSPQAASREKARVTVLLEINAHLLQEVVSLQKQGKAGASVQQSPTSPTTENFNSPVEGKPGPSKEYQECMRRLQANLSYLAAVADAKKRPDGKVVPFPAIISPPAHLTEVHELYRTLAKLFPEASQSAMNKAIAFASAQPSMPSENPSQGMAAG